MNSFLPWLRKEWLEAERSHRLLLLGLAAAFFAFLDPAMLKLLPLILRSQVGADLSTLIPATRDYAFATFLKDLFQIQTLVVCVALGGILARERRAHAFVIPITKGADITGIVLAKAAVHAAWLALLALAASFLSYLYAGLLFPAASTDLALPLRAGLSFALYFAYLVSLAVLASALAPSGAGGGLAALVLAYGFPALGALLKFGDLLPSWLALGAPGAASTSAGAFMRGPGLAPVLAAALAIALSLGGAVVAMRRRGI